MANEVDEEASAETIANLIDRCRQLKSEYDERHEVWVLFALFFTWTSSKSTSRMDVLSAVLTY